MAQVMLPADAIALTHGKYHRQLAVPTEIVLRADQSHYSLQFRYTRYWKIYTGEVVPHADGKGSYGKFFFITEVWNNQGDDGHTDYCLVGYRRCEDEEEVKAIYLEY